jgi:hypothetical protein
MSGQPRRFAAPKHPDSERPKQERPAWFEDKSLLPRKPPPKPPKRPSRPPPEAA